MKPIQLPIDDHLGAIALHLQSHSNLLIIAAPGAGKTTRVPAALLNAPWLNGKQILVLEPRRLAAKMAAARVAEERGVSIGTEVGYHFRFEREESEATRLLFLTEGMLLRRMMSDVDLEQVGAVVLDEFHERHVHTDLALAMLRRLQGQRPELRLIIMSATLDPAPLQSFLKDVSVMQVPGRMFDVVLDYDPDLSVVQAVLKILRLPPGVAGATGDILVFLTGMGDILRTRDELARAQLDDILVLPLHGELSRAEQDLAVKPTLKRKIILATNVAESSVTIPGVTVVIDSGLARRASFSHWSGLASLRTRPISRASAIQRAGRAGRTEPGRCIRLYSKADFERRIPHDVPEIKRVDLSQILLELAALGVNPKEFSWFELPEPGPVQEAFDLLHRLGVHDPEGHLTDDGRTMAQLGLHPRLGRLIIEGARYNVLAESIKAAVLLSERTALETASFADDIPKTSLQGASRLLFDRTLATAKRVLRGTFASTSHQSADPSRLLTSALLRAFPDLVGKRRSEQERELVMTRGGTLQLPNSLHQELGQTLYFLVLDADERQGHGQHRAKAIASVLASLTEEDVLTDPGGMLCDRNDLTWSIERGRVQCVSRMCYGDVVLSENTVTPSSDSDMQLARQMLAKQWWGKVPEGDKQQWQVRLSLVRQFATELNVPELTEDEIMARLEGVIVGFPSLSELMEQDWEEALNSGLDSGVAHLLRSDLPGSLLLPTGRRCPIHYQEGKSPWIESRIKDFFGMRATPKLMKGRLPLTIHLLAPNGRAVQVTQDLEGFWAREYPKLRPALSRRYPRHPWPEDPLKSL